MKTYLVILFSVISISVSAQAPSFGQQQDKGEVELSQISEASGIAASKKNLNVLWVHNDSGDEPRLFAMNTNGQHLGEFTISNIENRDWEDIAIAPGDEENQYYIYIAEIGDNNDQYSNIFIYRIIEPVVDAGQEPVNISLGNAVTVKLHYPDGARDAETLLVDPLTKDIYIVSKRENNVGVYMAAYPQSLTDIIELQHIANLPLTHIVGGDISIDGKEILLKNYDEIYYWFRDTNQTFADAFNNNQYYSLPYTKEPQGEAVCWSFNSNGYYTISEEPLTIFPAHLYFYPRLGPTEIKSQKNMNEGLKFNLEQNYPNPFNPVTNIRFQIADFHGNNENFVSLKVYNSVGEEIAEMLSGIKRPGNYELTFNGSVLASGVYFYKLQTNNFIEIKSMTLVK